MKELLEKLETTLEVKNPTLIQYLNDGISINDIDNEFKKIDIKVPPQLYELYQWHNGTDWRKAERYKESKDLLPFGIFIPISDVIDSYVYNSKMFDKELFYKKLPIFDSHIGERYLLDCNEQSETYGMIYFYSLSIIDFDTIITEFDSIESCLETIIEAYANDIINYSKVETEREYIEYVNLIKKHNPKSKYWQIEDGSY